MGDALEWRILTTGRSIPQAYQYLHMQVDCNIEMPMLCLNKTYNPYYQVIILGVHWNIFA